MKRFLCSLAGGLTALLISVPAFGQQPLDPGYGPHMWSGSWHWMFFGPLMMIVFIAIVVAVVVLIIRWLSGPTHGHPQSPAPSRREPIDILRERYAKGEIDKEEFEERRRVLGD